MNDFQKKRFSKKIISKLFNTVSSKKITFFGWAFKKNTNDTRESASIYVADHLIEDGAEIHVYDPKVKKKQIINDMKYLWDLNGYSKKIIKEKLNNIVVHDSYMSSVVNSHAIAILTEWDEFTAYDWKKIYKKVFKPAFIFDGRNILNHNKLTSIGFDVFSIGKG